MKHKTNTIIMAQILWPKFGVDTFFSVDLKNNQKGNAAPAHQWIPFWSSVYQHIVGKWLSYYMPDWTEWGSESATLKW